MYEITVKCATPEELSQVAAKLAGTGSTTAVAGNPALSDKLAKAEAAAEASKPAKAGKKEKAAAAEAAEPADLNQKEFLEKLKAFVQADKANAKKAVELLGKHSYANGMAVPEGKRSAFLSELGALQPANDGEVDTDALFGDAA